VLIAAAGTLKPVFLELGGKSTNLQFDDADLDTALPLSLFSCMWLAGQGCVLPTRLLVQRGVYEEVLARLAVAIPLLKTGVAYDPTSVVGPVISEVARCRVLGMIERASIEGDGRLLAGGRRLRTEATPGYFIEPTVFVDVKPDSRLAREEIFGPVLTVIPFDTEEEAIAIANDTFYGLGAYVQTLDLSRALRVAERLEAGTITVNGFPAMNPNAPFGGYKRSGYGRLGGREGLEEYLQTKNIFVTLPRRGA
jgi:aldehyde dehydrogenase (NAD+)